MSLIGFAACGDSSDPTPGTGGAGRIDGVGGIGGSGGIGGDTGIVGTSCRGTLTCPSSFYCEGECQALQTPEADTFPNCQPSPESCIDPEPPRSPRPICGCDGNVYADQCRANQAGTGRGDDCVDQSLWPEGRFRCWSDFCETGSEFCERPLGDGNDSNIYERCLPIPTRCMGLTDASELCECVSINYLNELDLECTTTIQDDSVGVTISYVLI